MAMKKCSKCNKKRRSKSYPYCISCRREYDRAYRKKNIIKIRAQIRSRGKKHIAQGLCYICSRPLASQAFCKYHLIVQRKLSKTRRLKTQRLKICYVCGGKLTTSKWYCQKCLKKRNDKKKENYAMSKAVAK